MENRYNSAYNMFIMGTKVKEKLFDSKVCISGRLFELDMMKAVVAVCLAVIHVFVECTPDAILDQRGVPYFFDSILGGPLAAPMFMFAMGIGLQLGNRQPTVYLLKRGFKLIGLGLLLNVLRFLIPFLLGYAITGDQEFYLDRLPYVFFGSDILIFAGLASLLMSLLQHFRLNRFWILGISAAMSLGAVPLNGLDTGNQALNIFLGHFIGIEDAAGMVESFNPLMIWFFLYASGYFFGYYLKRLRDKDRFYKIVTPIGLIISVGFMVIESVYGFGMMGGDGVNVFYHMLLHEQIICVFCAIGFMGVYHLALKNTPERFKNGVILISRCLTAIYVIQWVLVCWTVDFLIKILRGTTYLDTLPALLLGILLSVLSVVLARVWYNLRHRKKQS